MTLFWTAIIILCITAILNTLLFLSTYNSRENNTHLKIIFRVHILGVICWSFFILLLLLNAFTHNFPTYHAYETGYVLAQLVFLSATILFSTNYWFVQYFVHNKFIHSWLNYIVVGLQLIVALLSVIPNSLFTTITVESAGYTTLTLLPLNGIYGIFLLIHLLIPLFILFWHGQKETSGTKKSQYFIMLPTYFLFLLASMIFNWVLPVYFNIFNFNAYGPTTSVILVAGIFYAIARYDFLDIRTVIQRGLVYTASFSFIILLYAGTLSLSSSLFATSTVYSQAINCLIVTIITLVTVPRIDKFLRTITDPILFKGKYDYRTTIQELSEILQSSLEMDSLVSACEQKLTKVLRANYISIADKDTAVSDDAELRIPIKLQDKLTGLIIVGPKSSDDKYTDSDKQLLNTFANQAATAISRVLLYQEVKRRAEELEEKVIERTAELQAVQEKQKSMMLQISHNLQTPLAILQTKIDDLKVKHDLPDIAKNLTHSLRNLSDFISDLLRFARLENKQVEFDMESCNISDLLEELVEEISIIAEPKAITVTHNIEDDLHVTGDHRKLREVFMNLMSNALKYMGDSKERTITLTAKSTKDKMLCTITDTGIGLTEKQTLKIFERFYRAGGSTETGTGLGLAITKEIIEQHQGSVNVESTFGVGSTFTVTLPLLEQTSDE